jgi:alpha-1,2-mannosyltransferase
MQVAGSGQPEPAALSSDLTSRFLGLLAHVGFAAVAATTWAVASQPPRGGAVVPLDFLVYRSAVGEALGDGLYDAPHLGLPFAYPPSSVLLLMPTAVPGNLGLGLWFALNAAAVWCTMLLISRAAAPTSWWGRPAGASALATVSMLTFPTFHALTLGQVTPLLMALITAATLGPRRARDGILLGVAAAVKLTPLLFMAYWWVVGRRRDTWAAIGTFVALTLVGAVLLPQSSHWYYLQLGMLDLRTNTPAESPSNRSLLGVALRLGLPHGWGLPVSVALGAGAVLASLWVARRLTSQGWASVAVPLVGTWSGLIAPLGWAHAFVWWVPLAAAIALRGGQRRDRAVGAAILLVALVPPGLCGGTPASPGPWQSALYLVAAVLVTAWLAARVGGIGPLRGPVTGRAVRSRAGRPDPPRRG